MFLNDFIKLIFFSLSTNNTFCWSIHIFFSISIACLVFGSFISKSFIHNMFFSFALSVINQFSAKFLAFLFIDFI